jgi:hypothetical protein
MVDKISGFMRKRRDAKLYQQWVTKDGLPPEEVPQEPQSGKSDSLEDMAEDDFYGARGRYSVDSRSITLPIQYVKLGAGLIVLLLIIVAILITILIMKSC